MIPTPLELFGALAPALLCSSMPATPVQDTDVQAEPSAEAYRPVELYDHAELNAAILAIAGAHPDRAQTFAIGSSRAGREVLGLRLSGANSGAPARPGILLVAGLDGARAYTSSMALDHAMRLANEYGSDDAITALLDTTTVYVLPRLDADACEARFTAPLAEVSATGRGVDNDRDSRSGEDPPADVNGDGFISSMRVVDPEGEWLADPTDPRAMREAKGDEGERGHWKVYTEGHDADGDERVAEDAPLDAVLNRNFPRGWEEHAPDAGIYPTHEPQVRSMAEFLLDHTDIALVMTYGDEGNLVEDPESQGDDGPSQRGSFETGVFESDLPVYAEIGSRYSKLTGNETKGLGEQGGSFQGFAYHHRGLFCLDIDPWSVPLDAELEAGDEEESDETAAEHENIDEEEQEEAPEAGDDAKRLVWFDLNGQADAYIPWTAFDHPQLGAVEIGGFRPYALVEPPAAILAEITAKHFEFLLTLGAYLPRLELTEVEGKSLGSGLYEINAVLENNALLPQPSHAGVRSRTVRPARVRLSLPQGAELLGGRAEELVMNLDAVNGRHELKWLVGGIDDPGAIRVMVETNNAGQVSASVEVK